MAGRQPHELLDLPQSWDLAADRVIGLLLAIHVPAFISDQFGLFALMGALATAFFAIETRAQVLERVSPVQ